MSSDQWVLFWVGVGMLFVIMLLPVKYFLEALARKKAYLKEQEELKADEEAWAKLQASESTHPPDNGVPMKVVKYGRDLKFIEDYEVGANKGLGPIYRRQAHRHKWVFVGRGIQNAPPWPKYYEFECVGDYYCADKLRMDIEPMWGFVPNINPVVAGFNRTRYKMRAHFLRETMHDRTMNLSYHATAHE